MFLKRPAIDAARELLQPGLTERAMGYAHRKVSENRQTTVYERTDEGLFGWGILATASKDYVAVDNQTGLAVSGSTLGEARAKLAQVEGKQLLGGSAA